MKRSVCFVGLLLILIHAPSVAWGAKNMALTLKDVIEIVIHHNLNLKLERITPRIRNENLTAAESFFDPDLSFQGNVMQNETLDAPVDKETINGSVTAELTQPFAYGTTLSLGATHTKSDTDIANSAATGGRTTDVTLVVSQPLLKNRGIPINRRNIITAENNLAKARLDLEQSVIDAVSEAQTRYWQYYSAIESLAVQEKSLILAERFLTEVEAKANLGAAARLDTLQAKSEKASREEAVIAAQNEVKNAQDHLLNYIYGRLPDADTLTVLDKPFVEPLTLNEAAMIETAFGKRIDYRSAKIDLNTAEVDLKFYENQKLPQLSTDLTLGVTDASPRGGATGESAYQDNYSASLALRLHFPWGLRQDKANYRAAFLSKKQRRIQLDTIKNQIIIDVRKGLRNVKAAYKRVKAAEIASDLAEESLAAETVKFKNGLSTSYNVLLYQRDLTKVKASYVDAVIHYQTAIIALYKTVGITLKHHNIEIKKAAL